MSTQNVNSIKILPFPPKPILNFFPIRVSPICGIRSTQLVFWNFIKINEIKIQVLRQTKNPLSLITCFYFFLKKAFNLKSQAKEFNLFSLLEENTLINFVCTFLREFRKKSQIRKLSIILRKYLIKSTLQLATKTMSALCSFTFILIA